MRTLRRLASIAVAALGAICVAADPASPLAVAGAEVRFRSPSASDDALEARLSFAADALPAFDPATDDVELRIGSSDVFRVGPDSAASVRVRRSVVSYRRERAGVDGTPNPFRHLVLDLRRGLLRARVDGAGAFALSGDSEWTVPVRLRIGAAEFSTIVDFAVSRDGRTWRGPAGPDRSIRFVPEPWRWLDSSIREPRTLVVRDAATWAALWAEHVRFIDPPVPLEPVDFSRDMVVAVFRQGTGIGLTMDGFEKEPGRIVARFTVHESGPNCLVPQYVAHLHAFALLPRTDLPVEFDERRVVVDCRR